VGETLADFQHEVTNFSPPGLTVPQQRMHSPTPFGNLEPLALLKTNLDGTGITQSVGPLKALAGNAGAAAGASSRRFLIITDVNDPSLVVLRQANL